jgi:hypothetical protein
VGTTPYPRRFAQCRHPYRAPARTQIHFRSSPNQPIRLGCRPVRLRRGVLGQAGSPTLRDFAIHEDSPEATRHISDDQERLRTVPSEHKCQSEHDWAYAKRVLPRGDDPEVVIQRIADYRSDDKADPNYYGRRTVTKAQTELKSSSSPQIPGSVAGEESSQDRGH